MKQNGKRNEQGLCNSDSSKGIFRRKPSTSSSRTRLTPPVGPQSCPVSPKHSSRRRPSNQQIPEDREMQFTTPSSSLSRSSSTLSHTRPRSSPAGLYSYTDSAPSSVHVSKQDLTALTDKGSAIYLGCAPPRGVGSSSGSAWSLSSRVSSSGGSAPQTPINTPPVSPRQAYKRSNSMTKKTR